MASEMEKLEWEVLRLINEARDDPEKALRDRGLAHKYDPVKYPPRDPLRMNVSLRDEAQVHAQLMADLETLAHELPGHYDRVAGETALAEQFGLRPNQVMVWSVATDGRDADEIVYNWLESDAGHRDTVLGYTLTGSGVLYETVLVGLGARRSGSGTLYTDGLIAWVEGGFADLYVRDNEDDVGLVPTTGVTSESPDIRIYKELPPIPNNLRENPEYGEDNYVFVTVHNAGSKTSGEFTVELYWADPGTNLVFPDAWHTEGIHGAEEDDNRIKVSGVPPREGQIDGQMDVGPFIWCPPNPETGVVQGDGYLCLYARVDSEEDPIVHETNWSDREYENNLAQRNVTVLDEVVDAECRCSIDLCGGSKIDVHIDPGRIMQDWGMVYFRLRSRLLEGVNLQGLEVMETTPGGQITTLACTAPGPSTIRGIDLASGETSRAELWVKLPPAADDGTTYPTKISQTVGGRCVGSVTVVARVAANPTYIGNQRSGELHLRTCKWVGRMASRNKKPFSDIETAHRRGYDNCAFCLGGSKR